MAWMLLTTRMPDDRSNRLKFSDVTLVGSLVAWLLVSSAAWGQTGVSTTRLASQHDAFAALPTMAEHLSHLQGQPQLEKHLARINRFRTLFHAGNGSPDRQVTGLSRPRLTSTTIVPRAPHGLAPISVRSRWARAPPSPSARSRGTRAT